MILLKKWLQIGAILVAALAISGCTNETKVEEKAAYISVNENSTYQDTFEDLHLGILYDYNFKVNQADKRWVKFWIEAYQDGKKVDQIYLPEMNYGESPNPVDMGQVGLGIMEPSSENVSMFMYSTSGRQSFGKVNELFRNEEPSARMWTYTIGTEPVGLDLGEDLIIGGYRQAEGNAIRTYDFQDPESLQQMIKEDRMVLLLKIMVHDKPPISNRERESSRQNQNDRG